MRRDPDSTSQTAAPHIDSAAHPRGLPLALGRGPHRPTAGTPPRERGSIRRTTTIDICHPDGFTGDVHISGAGRDLTTPSGSGAPYDSDRAGFVASVDYLGNKQVLTLETRPERRALRALHGASAIAGFRASLRRCEPELAATHGVLHQLLDDLPIATLLAGHAHAANSPRGLDLAASAAHGEADWVARARDQCAGWADGATIMNEVDTVGRPPLTVGPPAPLLTSDDPWAWHSFRQVLPAHSLRRVRRIDVQPGELIRVDAMFRDSYQPPDGPETILHEYAVTAAVRSATLRVEECAAQARVLPWPECPMAAASADRVVGRNVEDLAHIVSSTFTGPTTCTHLNDALRALSAVPQLVQRCINDDYGRASSVAPDRR